jgi:CobQ-like glutamine amidotransferase family enzyme
MIRLGALFPDHLNLNGDLGNLEVIAKQLEWRGIASETLAIRSVHDLGQGVDFIFVGHGSLAAWVDIRDTFVEMAPILKQLLTTGTPGLAISSGFEELALADIFSNLSPAPIAQRISKFEIYHDGESEVLGYVNTEVDLPMLHREGNWIGSMLHGPILAKNSTLLEEVLTSVAKHAAVPLAPIQANEKAGQLADLISEVWKLEKDLASE